MKRRSNANLAPHPDTAELAENRLRRSGYPALQHISCEFRAGVLTLRGHVPRYYSKQIAQSVVGQIEGVEQIDNQIEVVPLDRREARR
jgi:osmotically-inducible protein OsmY